jgi:hypothetical protein
MHYDAVKKESMAMSFIQHCLLIFITLHHHHHQPINVPTAGAQAFLMDYT